jgi:hypothetical protein
MTDLSEDDSLLPIDQNSVSSVSERALSEAEGW